MKKILFLLLSGLLCQAVLAQKPHEYELIVAPATVTHNAATLLWQKHPGRASVYDIMLDGKLYTSTDKTNCILGGLKPGREYTASVLSKSAAGANGQLTNTITFTTKQAGRQFNILKYGAKAGENTNNTKAIQAAINACTPGGTVVIPTGTFVSGALFLKSDMTLLIQEGGVLQGSAKTEDYLPMIMNRFEGWEMKTYASLLNAGTLNRDGSYNVKNLRITGKGTIRGGGGELGKAMWEAGGERTRGRLICLINCQDVCIADLTLTNPPSWNLHYIYSNNITCQGLKIKTYGIRNGDGIDPDSSTDSYIFNCSFDTGDDCIAIKSGKNPEGFYVGKPTSNVRITNCDFIRGHGISIGSEMSGGVSEVLVEDCKAGALLNGMQIKGTKERGGYVKNVAVNNCALQKITVFSKLNYNNDGEGAPEPPVFENFLFKDIDMSMAPVKDAVININGFADEQHKLANVVFQDIIMPENAKVIINDATQVIFKNVKTAGGRKPEYVQNNSRNIVQD